MANKSTDNRTLGSVPLSKGYTNDSMGLGIDPGAWYFYEASNGRLTALWRIGVGEAKELTRDTQTMTGESFFTSLAALIPIPMTTHNLQ